MAFFDWDDISVGNTELDNSDNFFSRKHDEHERFDEMDLLQKKMAKTEIVGYVQIEKFTADNVPISTKCTPTDGNHNDKTPISNIDIKNKKDECAMPQTFHKVEYNLECERILREKSKNETNCSVEINKNDNNKEPTPIKCSSIVDKLNHETVISNMSIKTVKSESDRQQACHKLISNLACEWSTKKTLSSKDTASKGAISKSMRPPPQSYRAKEEAERRRAEEERKMREFHSRPAPKFNHNQMLQKRVAVHAVTLPVTPHVLKRSREAEEKRRKKLEELKRKNQPPRFESRRPTVLREKPFVPQKTPTIVQQCLFNLQTEKRLKERKHYDELKQKDLELKRKQEEDERKRLEKECIRELRKATTFKARPNPFKN